MKLLSIVIPCYNEEQNLFELMTRLGDIYEQVSDRYDIEIILINDGSKDNTWAVMTKICKSDDRVKAINLSRNFGHQGALTAGLEAASGDVVVSMDADMQDPPELILDMLDKHETGADIVYARRIKRNDNFLKKHTAIWYYKILSKVSDIHIPRNVGDFRLVSRTALDAFLTLREKDRYIRGMMAWLGFSVEYVDFDRPERVNGKTGRTWKKMIKFAMDGVLNFSFVPLKVGFLLGSIMIFMAFVFFVYVTIDFLVNGTYYPLYKWLTIMMFGFMGLQFIFMWIMGEYIGRIYNETRDRPIYVVSEKLNF